MLALAWWSLASCSILLQPVPSSRTSPVRTLIAVQPAHPDVISRRNALLTAGALAAAFPSAEAALASGGATAGATPT